jgi:hypothetical protein
MEIEFPKQPQHYIGKKCKLLIAECIKQDDNIRPYCDILTKQFIDLQNNYHGFTVLNKNIYTETELYQLINENTDADVLLISAHGHYNRKQNIAGLIVGDDLCVGLADEIRVPPLVLLSACHTSPRGRGAVSVADMFIRNGAMAVLGTFIPVDVKRNTKLMLRFFIYILETQEGNEHIRNISELWSFIVSTNAIHEIVDASPSLKSWMGEKQHTISRMEDFQLNRCRNRLTAQNAYEVTIQIIKEMLKEENMSGKFSNVLDDYDFFPESLFYQLIGYPENILIYNELFEEAHRNHLI